MNILPLDMLSIVIGMNPYLIDVGGVVITWHGVFTLIGVVVAVILGTRWAVAAGVHSDDAYSIAVWAIIGGVFGARLIHVIDRWSDVYSSNPGKIFAVWEGGIAIYGAVVFAFVGSALCIQGRKFLGEIYLGNRMIWFKNLMGNRIASGYLNGDTYKRFKNISIGRIADITAPAMIIAMTIGRIGDIINGEHLAQRTDSVWGFVYTHSASASNYQWGLLPSHPVIGYEMLWNIIAVVILWKLRGRLAPAGMLFAMSLMLYSIGRFFIQFLRLDKEWVVGLQEAHIIALVILAITVPLVTYKAQWVKRNQ